MATKKPAEVQTEELEQQAEVPADRNEDLRAEYERLKKQLEELQKQQAARRPGGGGESDYDRIHRIEKEALAEGKDLFEVTAGLIVPHKAPSEDPWYWINVNGRSVQIPANDEWQEMRLPFAIVLVDTLRSEKRAAAYKDSLEVFDPVTNPHKEEQIRSGS